MKLDIKNKGFGNIDVTMDEEGCYMGGAGGGDKQGFVDSDVITDEEEIGDSFNDATQKAIDTYLLRKTTQSSYNQIYMVGFVHGMSIAAIFSATIFILYLAITFVWG